MKKSSKDKLNSNKISKITSIQTNVSILSYILSSGSAFGSMGFTNPPDGPVASEITVIWIGSANRITVFASSYGGGSGIATLYFREIFGSNWNQDWSQACLRSNDVINSLASTSVTLPLAAAQGKALSDGKQDITDSTLTTAAKTIVGAINELAGKAIPCLGYVTGTTILAATAPYAAGYGVIGRASDGLTPLGETLLFFFSDSVGARKMIFGVDFNNLDGGLFMRKVVGNVYHTDWRKI